MKNAAKMRRPGRGTPTGTRAGKGGRKQARARTGRRSEVDELAADMIEDPHPARALAGEVGDGRREQQMKGAASARRGSNPSGPATKKQALMRQGAVAPRAEPSRRGAKQWTGGRRDRRKYR